MIYRNDRCRAVSSGEAFHLHIGPGALGLGFVGEHAERIGLPLTFLYRKGNEVGAALASAKSYIIRRPGRESHHVRNISAAVWEDRSGRFTKVSETARRLFIRDAPLLLTTAVGREQLGGVAVALADALVKRVEATDAPTVVIACENFAGASEVLRSAIEHELFGKRHELASLMALVRRNVVFLNAVVDRICYKPTIEPPDRVRVRAGVFSEWFVRAPSVEASEPLEPLLSRLRRVAHLVSAPTLEVYERRKLWCVNGVHLAIGILGGRRAYWNVGQTLSDSELKHRLFAIQRAMAAAVRAYARRKSVKGPFGPSTLARYNSEVLARLEATPNDDLGRLFEDVTRVDRASRQGRRVVELTARLVELSALVGEDDEPSRGVKAHAQAQTLREATRGLLRVVDVHGTLTKVNERIVEPMTALRPGRDRAVLERLLVDVLVEMARISGRARDAVPL